MSCCGSANKYKFKANLREKPITNKFWSINNGTTNILDYSKISYYEKEIENIRKYDARCHYKVPRYTNQTYGWLPGYKIRFLQNCDLNIQQKLPYQKLAKDLVQQHFRSPKSLIEHCACKEFLKHRDQWKIV